jgi:hypothetical protein
MTGTFHAVVGEQRLVVSSEGRIRIGFDGGNDDAGTFRPDPYGAPGRYLAKLYPTSENAPGGAPPEPSFCLLSFDPAIAVWQVLGRGDTPNQLQVLEDDARCVDRRNGIVRYKRWWFEDRFVPDGPLPAAGGGITPEVARRQLVGVWENFGEGFGVVSLYLLSDGYGIFGASVAGMPCSWRIRKTGDGWLVACKIYEGGSSPDQINTSDGLLKADARLQRLQLLAIDRTLEAATAAAKALDSNEKPSYLYHSCDTVPAELASQLAEIRSMLNLP